MVMQARTRARAVTLTGATGRQTEVRMGFSTLGADAGRSGIGRYVIQLLDEMSRPQDPGVRLDLIVARGEESAFPSSGAHRHLAPRFTRNPLGSLAWHQVGLPKLCASADLDVLFLPAANRSGVLWSPVPTVGTVHDFSSLHVRGKYDRARDLYITRVLPALVRRLDHVITPSLASKQDIVEYAGVDPARVTVIPNGVDHTVYSEGDGQEARRRVRTAVGLDGPYLLYVSRLEHPGKNHVRLIRAFSQLTKTRRIPHTLVLAGPDWTRADEIHRAAAASGLGDRIRFLGFVPQGLLPDLNRAADMVVFPSLYEGFGIPVLEAMASGVPVVASGTSSIPEVGGDAAIYFDPMNEESMAEAIWTVVDDAGLRRQMVRSGLERSRSFSWARTARETLEVILNQARSR